MAIQSNDTLDPLARDPLARDPASYYHHRHAVCWRSIFAGATVAAALTIILCVLGTGLGFTAISPWSSEGISAKAFGISAILWLSLTQVVASGMGGFLSARLRNTTSHIDRDEVYFRDTAHGFLTWSVALIVTATLFASALTSVIGSGVQAAGKVAGGAVAATGMAAHADSMQLDQGYYIDALFRKNTNALVPATPKTSAGATPVNSAYPGASGETRRIIAKGLEEGELAKDDATYLAQMISQRTGLTTEDAEQRVNDTFAALQKAEAKVKASADEARKASAYVTLWGFIALLIGAFTASWAATWGGRCRDQMRTT